MKLTLQKAVEKYGLGTRLSLIGWRGSRQFFKTTRQLSHHRHWFDGIREDGNKQSWGTEGDEIGWELYPQSAQEEIRDALGLNP